MRSQTLATNDALYLGDLQILDEQYFEGEGMAGPSSDFNNMRLLPKPSVIALNCSKTFFFSDRVIRHSGRTIHRIKPPLFVAMGCLERKQQMMLKTFSLFLIWYFSSMQQYKPSQGIYIRNTDNFARLILVCLGGQRAYLKHKFWLQIETRWVFAETSNFDIVRHFYLIFSS